MITQRKYELESKQFADLINNLIFKNDLTGKELATITGKSQGQVSNIRDPRQDRSQWTILDIPPFLHELDGKAILRFLCGLLGQINVDKPLGKPNHNHIMGSAGQLLTTVSDAIRDGELTCQEIHQIKGKLAELIGAIETLTARGGK